MTKTNAHILLGHIIPEFILFNFCVLISFLTPFLIEQPNFGFGFIYFLKIFLLHNLIWMIVIIYKRNPNFYTIYTLSERFKHLFVNVLLYIGFATIFSTFFTLAHFTASYFLSSIFLFLILNFLIQNVLLQLHQQKNKAVFTYNSIIIGRKEDLAEIQNFETELKSFGFNCIGYLEGKNSKANLSNPNFLGNIQKLPEILSNKVVDKIFIFGEALNKWGIKHVVEEASSKGIQVNLAPNNKAYMEFSLSPKILGNWILLQHHQSPLDKFNNYLLKRLFDFISSLFLIILMLPFFILIPIVLLIFNRGSVFEENWLIGAEGVLFKSIRFTTNSSKMDQSSEKTNFITKIFQRYKLDRLPELLNVFWGDMSLIGPSPNNNANQKPMTHHVVKPGIISFEEATEKSKKVPLDANLLYIQNWSLGLDLKILLAFLLNKKEAKLQSKIEIQT